MDNIHKLRITGLIDYVYNAPSLRQLLPAGCGHGVILHVLTTCWLQLRNQLDGTEVPRGRVFCFRRQRLSSNLIKQRCKVRWCQGGYWSGVSLSLPQDLAAGHQSEADIGVALCQLEVTGGDHGARPGLCPGAAQLGVHVPRLCGGVTRLTACATCEGRLLARAERALPARGRGRHGGRLACHSSSNNTYRRLI